MEEKHMEIGSLPSAPSESREETHFKQSAEGKGNAGSAMLELIGCTSPLIPQTRAADATTDKDAAASTTADGDGEPFIPTGVLIGHRILRSYGENTDGCLVLRTPRCGAEIEVPSALFMGTVVAYRPPKAYEELKLRMAKAAEHEGENGHDNERLEDDNRTKKEKTCQSPKKPRRGRPKKDAVRPLDYALYRVQFDDGDVADMEPQEVFQYSRLYDAKVSIYAGAVSLPYFFYCILSLTPIFATLSDLI